MCLGNTPKKRPGVGNWFPFSWPKPPGRHARGYAHDMRSVGSLLSTSLRIGPLRVSGSISNRQRVLTDVKNLLLLVRFLYMIRCPHSLQRIGSRGLISFFAPQSVLRKGLIIVHKRKRGAVCTCTEVFHFESLTHVKRGARLGVGSRLLLIHD